MKPCIRRPGKKLTKTRLVEVEKEFDIRLPDSYRAFMLKNNGGYPEPYTVCCKGKKEPSGVCKFFRIIDSERSFEDWVSGCWAMKDKDRPILPLRLVPIADDPFGNM